MKKKSGAPDCDMARVWHAANLQQIFFMARTRSDLGRRTGLGA